MISKLTDLERFMAKIQVNENGCWLWTAGLYPKGYAMFSEKGKNARGHRWAYEHFIGPVPEGKALDHLCRIRHCVNPHHLEPVTWRENTLRGAHPNAILHNLGVCAKGHPLKLRNRSGDSGYRHCPTCGSIKSKERYHRLKALKANRNMTKAQSNVIEFPKSPSSRTSDTVRKPLTTSVAKGGGARQPVKRIHQPHPVKARLKELNWTMDQLAAKVGVSPATIRNHLAGRHRMSEGKFNKMLRVLSMDRNDYWQCGPGLTAVTRAESQRVVSS